MVTCETRGEKQPVKRKNAESRKNSKQGEGLDDDEDEDGLEERREVYMAIFVEKGTLGVAAYDALSTKLKTLSIPINTTTLAQNLHVVKTQLEPCAIIVSRQNYRAYEGFKSLKDGDPVEICFRNSGDFDCMEACKCMLKLRIKADGDKNWQNLQEMTEQKRYQNLRCHFDFDNSSIIRSVGALLQYLSCEKIVYCVNGPLPISIQAVEKASLKDIMFIDADTFKSLQIFNPEYQLSLLQDNARAKEGMSINSLLDHTLTKSGKAMLRDWMLSPLTNIDLINERQDAIEFFLELDSTEFFDFLKKTLKEFKDVGRCLLRMRKMQSNYRDWIILDKAIASFLIIRQEVMALPIDSIDRMPFIKQFVQLESIQQLKNLLDQVVNMEATISEKHCVVRNGVSPQLDNAREKKEQVDHIVHNVTYDLARTYPDISEIKISFAPRYGFVISCSKSSRVPSTFAFQYIEGPYRVYKANEEMILNNY
ncbi:mutS protein-like 5 [Thraustotheca clavata]|uniref:MutS protein-like 5 n=1 Tax=Thraustotheca clavata TaxID=74557 RepID=A0A1W0A2S6_9STRA|nr:mutS protein-like 5 [Thraustotheca clavata]